MRIIFIMTIFLTAGCGIKPGDLSAPPGAEDKQYPLTYPPAPAGQN